MQDAFKICNEITKKSASNLWFVSRALSPKKHRLFTSSYASMRVIDDYVDDVFLTLPKDKRKTTRDTANIKIDKWLKNAKDASNREFLNQDSDYPAIFSALNETLGKSSLDHGPWQRMANAMSSDVAEKPLKNWDDFINYCKGATVAPAEVFLYVLSSDVTSNDCFAVGETSNFRDLAHEMAIFCYLVHIMRDISKDSMQGGQLITIPDDILASCELDRNTMGNDANKEQLRALIALLSQKANDLLPELDRKESLIKAHLGQREKIILTTLLSIYRRLFDKITSKPDIFIKGDAINLDDDRQQIARDLNLATTGG